MGSIAYEDQDLGPNDVRSTIRHLHPKDNENRRYVCPGGALNTADYETHEVTVRDVRPRRDEYTLERKGFELAHCPIECSNWDDIATIEREVFPPLESYLKQRTGADIVFCHMPRLRQSKKDPNNRNVQPVAGDVHVDVDVPTARNLADKWLREQGKSDLKYSRVMFLSNWRALSDPPQDYPLALCDPDSLSDTDGKPTYLIACPDLPDSNKPYPPVPPMDDANAPLVDAHLFATEDRLIGAGYGFHYDPKLRWCYYADMVRDELLSFKLADTKQDGPWRVPHVAFLNERPGTVPRCSLEVRTYCIWK